MFTSFDGGTAQIWTMGTDGSGRRQLTTDGSNGSPRPTADGRTIFFVTNRSGRAGIWRMDASGAGQRLVAEAPESWDLALSSDDRTLLFTGPSVDRVDSTWTVPTAGGQPSLLVKGLTHAVESPDGRAVAGFWQARPDAPLALAVFPVAGGNPERRLSRQRADGQRRRVVEPRRPFVVLHQRGSDERLAAAAQRSGGDGRDWAGGRHDRPRGSVVRWPEPARGPGEPAARRVPDHRLPLIRRLAAEVPRLVGAAAADVVRDRRIRTQRPRSIGDRPGHVGGQNRLRLGA